MPEFIKNILRSGRKCLIISNEEIKVCMRIVRSLEEFGLFIKGVTKTIEN